MPEKVGINYWTSQARERRNELVIVVRGLAAQLLRLRLVF